MGLVINRRTTKMTESEKEDLKTEARQMLEQTHNMLRQSSDDTAELVIDNERTHADR